MQQWMLWRKRRWKKNCTKNVICMDVRWMCNCALRNVTKSIDMLSSTSAFTCPLNVWFGLLKSSLHSQHHLCRNLLPSTAVVASFICYACLFEGCRHTVYCTLSHLPSAQSSPHAPHASNHFIHFYSFDSFSFSLSLSLPIRTVKSTNQLHWSANVKWSCYGSYHCCNSS